MILRTWSTDADGVELEFEEHPCSGPVQATAILVADLFDTASDEFFTAAVREFVNTGKITRLAEDVGNTVFWNAEVYT